VPFADRIQHTQAVEAAHQIRIQPDCPRQIRSSRSSAFTNRVLYRTNPNCMSFLLPTPIWNMGKHS
jgi:hypothetical protein